MQRRALQWNVVQCSAVQCTAVKCSAEQCSAVQCSAVQCSAVQCSAVQCSVVQNSAVQCSAAKCNTPQWIAMATMETGGSVWSVITDQPPPAWPLLSQLLSDRQTVTTINWLWDCHDYRLSVRLSRLSSDSETVTTINWLSELWSDRWTSIQPDCHNKNKTVQMTEIPYTWIKYFPSINFITIILQCDSQNYKTGWVPKQFYDYWSFKAPFSGLSWCPAVSHQLFGLPG